MFFLQKLLTLFTLTLLVLCLLPTSVLAQHTLGHGYSYQAYYYQPYYYYPAPSIYYPPVTAAPTAFTAPSGMRTIIVKEEDLQTEAGVRELLKQLTTNTPRAVVRQPAQLQAVPPLTSEEITAFRELVKKMTAPPPK